MNAVDPDQLVEFVRAWWHGFIYGFTIGATVVALGWLAVGTGLERTP